MDLEGKSAVVTGGAGGLGAATVRRLVSAGMRVVVFDRDDVAVKSLADELGEPAIAVVGDVTDEGDASAAIGAAAQAGTLAVVVNVAGGGPGGRTVRRDGTPHRLEEFRNSLELNTVGTFNVTRLAAAAMSTNEPDGNGERGVIVNTASIAGYEGQAGQVAYAAAKGAILGMTLPLARDLAPLGVRVCAIAPGTMGTPLMLRAPDELKEKLTQNIMFPKRFGAPDEFAMLVESIVRNPYLNGENIRLDGALRFPPK